MKKIDYSPEAKLDMIEIKNSIAWEFGEKIAINIVRKIVNSIRTLGVHENAGVEIAKKFGILCDYRYFFSNKNYIFYRVQGDYIKIIRVLNEKQDFMQILFGITTASEETEEYWEE